MRRSPPAWLVAAALLAAVGLRVWVLGSPIGRADADEAVVGLMARDLLHGHVPVFFWGQAHGGSLEPTLVAGLFAVAGSSALALKLVALVLSGVAAVLVWRVGRRTVGEPAATVAGVLFPLYPPAFVFWSTKERGFYWMALVVGLAVLLAALRIAERTPRPRPVDVAALGFLAGLGWWTSPQTYYLAGPVLVWLAFRHRRSWRAAWPALPAVVVGASPWIVWNVAHNFASLHEATPWESTTYPERLARFFERLLPTVLGVRAAYSGTWLLGAAGVALYAGLLAVFAVFLTRLARDRRRWAALEPLVAVALAYPFLFALPGASYFVAEPRYGLLLAPVVVLLVSGPLVSHGRQVVAAGTAGLLGVVAVAGLLRHADRNPLLVDLVPSPLGPLELTLTETGATRVYADYWVAYPLTFETDERLIGSPVDAVRSARVRDAVEGAGAAAYVLYRGSPRDRVFAATLDDRHLGYRRIETGDFAVFLLDHVLLPDELAPLWRS